MRKILKNYLKNFTKNWVETFGFLLFIIALLCALFGVISGPLQMFAGRLDVLRYSTAPNYFLRSDNSSNFGLNGEYLINKFYYSNSENSNTDNEHYLRFEKNDINYSETYFNYKEDDNQNNNVYKSLFLDAYIKAYNLNKLKIEDFKSILKKLNNWYREHSNNSFFTFNLTDKNSDSNILNLDGSSEEEINHNIDEEKMIDFKKDSKILDKFYQIIASDILKAFNDSKIPLKYSELPNYTDKNINAIVDSNGVEDKIEITNLYGRHFKSIIKPISDWKIDNDSLKIDNLNRIKYNYFGSITNWVSTNWYAQNIEERNIKSKDMIILNDFLFSPPTYQQDIKSIFIVSSDSYSLINDSSVENDLNKLVLFEGKKPSFHNSDILSKNKFIEVAVSESYAKLNNIKINDIIHSEKIYGCELKVVGIGSKYTYLYPDNYQALTKDFSKTGYIYMPNQAIYFLRSQSALENNYSNNPNINMLAYQTTAIKTNDKNNIQKLLYNKTGKTIFIKSVLNNLNKSFSASDSGKALKIQLIQVTVYLVLGLIVTIMAIIFINLIIKKELNQTRKQIGIFKAMGYRTYELSWIFSLKVFITMFIGALFGYILSIPLQQFTSTAWQSQTTIYIQPINIRWWTLSSVFLFIPLLISSVSFYLNYRYIKENNISLLNNPNKVKTNRISLWNKKYLNKKMTKPRKRNFGFKLMNSFTRQSLGKFVIVNIILFITCFTTFAELTALSVLDQTINGVFQEYKDNYKGMFYLNPEATTQLQYNSKKDSETNIEDNNFEIGKKNKYDIYDYKDTAKEKYDSLESYISKKNNENISLVIGKRLSNLVRIIGNEVKKNPYVLALPVNSSGINPWNPEIKNNALFKLLFSKFNQSNYNSDPFNNKTYDQVNPIIEKDLKSILDDTLLGISIGSGTKDKPYNFFYLKDFTRIQQLIKFTENVNSYISENPSVTKSDINKEFYGKTDIDNTNLWGISSFDKSANNNYEDYLSSINPNVDNQTASLLSLSTLVSKNKNINPLLTFNSLFYNSSYDTLGYEMTLKGDKLYNDNPFRLFDFSSQYSDDEGQNYELNLGSTTNTFNYKGVSKNQYNQLTKVNTNGSYNVLISNCAAKYGNLSVGSNIKAKTANNYNVNLYVVGIIKNINLSYQIIGDYKAFMNYNGININQAKSEDNENAFDGSKLPLTSFYSHSNIYDGEIDFRNISGSIRKFQFEYPFTNINMENDSNFFANFIFKALSGNDIAAKIKDLISKETNIKLNNNYNILNDANVIKNKFYSYNLSSFDVPSFSSYNLQKSAVKQFSSKAKLLIYIFITLTSLLIMIVLIVIMSIIIDESINIILTLKAIGYRKTQINIIILGNYILAGVVIFFASLLFNTLLWQQLAKIAWSEATILITIPISFKDIAFTFAQTILILTVGYLTCELKNRKSSITKITS